ncbi:uncharacterized protein LOC121403781 [Drosophila obscura]|uniref:uncharacterized protein LOC121403781 n=1 Tax=Drosophila obscura TaxID=7282 RepID=UPI001BB1A8AE|nr:uncharacterized protein LOC121403781 [Drosophila obscura]
MRIDPRESMELARLCGRSLRTLECQFYDPLDIQLLSELTELEELHLTVAEVLGNISPMVLEVIKSCPRLATIHISNVFMNRPSRVDIKSSFMLVGMLEACRDKIDIQINGGCISFDRETNKLLVAINLYYRNNLLMEALACLRPLNHLEITGCLAAGSLRDLFAALATRTTHYLQSLSIDKGSLDFGDTMELAKITTWTSFTGQLSDVRSFWHLIHLSDFKVFEKRIGGRKITFDQSTGKLTVSPLNVSLGDRLANGIGLNPLAGLQNLRKVFIAGVFEYGSMRDFLGQLAACQGETLQELRVDRRYEMSNEELREVSRMKSLRTLVCSVSHVQDIEIEQLAHLPHLAVLVVGSHRAGSLKNLLGSLAASKCPTLVHLAVRGESLTPQEVTEVSAIGSLKGLECAFCSTEGLDVLSQRNCIEHLGITTRED